jgi:hypothetical protein
MAIANEQLVDIDDVLRRYRGKTENSAVTTQSNTVKNFFFFFFSSFVMCYGMKRNERKRKRNEALQSIGLARALDFNSFFFLIYTRINFLFRCQTSVCVLTFLL